jgi:hypothetical protein
MTDWLIDINVCSIWASTLYGFSTWVLEGGVEWLG